MLFSKYYPFPVQNYYFFFISANLSHKSFVFSPRNMCKPTTAELSSATCFAFASGLANPPCLYTLHFTPKKIAQKCDFSCIYHPKALLLHQNILKQLWNTNLVLAVVLRLFVSTRIPLSANVQAWNSLPLLVHIWQRNTPTNASAASACWSSLSKQCLFIIPNDIRVFPASKP